MKTENFLLLFLTSSTDQLFPILTLSKTRGEKCAIPWVNKLPAKRQKWQICDCVRQQFQI